MLLHPTPKPARCVCEFRLSKARKFNLVCASSTSPHRTTPCVVYESFTLLMRWKTICCVASALCASSTSDARMTYDMAPQAPQKPPKEDIVKTETISATQRQLSRPMCESRGPKKALAFTLDKSSLLIGPMSRDQLVLRPPD